MEKPVLLARNVPSPVNVCIVKPGLVVTVPPPAATEPA
jgi:hypothetical protein